MRSHLTRNVHRRLLAIPIRPRHSPAPTCPAAGRALSTSTSTCPPPPRQLRRPRIAPAVRRPPAPRRTFFGRLFQKPPRRLKEPEVEPGYLTMLRFQSMQAEGVRLPPRDVLLQAFRDFFQHKYGFRSYEAATATQAFLAARLLRYLLDSAVEGGEPLTLEDLRVARSVALKYPPGDSPDHAELSRLLYDEIRRRASEAAEEEGGEIDPDCRILGGEAVPHDFKLYITALIKFGDALEAAARLNEHWGKLREEGKTYKSAGTLWILVAEGLAREGREEELLQQVRNAEAAGIGYSPSLHEVMTTFFAKRDRVAETKHWFGKPITKKLDPRPETLLEVVRFALRNGEKEWLQSLFEKLINSGPLKAHWDVILQWAVLAMNKGADDIKQMMLTMAKHEPRPGQSKIRPDTETLNSLVRAAIEKKDPYLAERFVSICSQMGIKPDATTWILQMDSRLDAQDLGGVHAIHQMLQAGEVQVRHDEDVPVLNKYIRALCAQDKPDVNRIVDITGALEDRQARLEPETVVSLCMFFLKSDQQYDVIDTLSLHTVNLSVEERQKIRKAFVEYCLDRRNSTQRVWDGYSLLRQFFPETEPEDRVRLMDAFFERRRPDMACHIFGHMRAHDDVAQRPTADVYARCLEGLGRHPDADALRMVHNMLKTDTTLQLDTRLRSALMLAHAACGDAGAALDHWDAITTSAEGPSYNTLAIFFRTCEALPRGDARARPVWQKMARLELDVPASVAAAYCGAIAAHGHVEEVKRFIQGMDASVGYPPSVTTLGVTYNALPGEDHKADFEHWAQDEYPELWARLLTKGRRMTMEGQKFRLVTDMKA